MDTLGEKYDGMQESEQKLEQYVMEINSIQPTAEDPTAQADSPKVDEIFAIVNEYPDLLQSESFMSLPVEIKTQIASAMVVA